MGHSKIEYQLSIWL